MSETGKKTVIPHRRYVLLIAGLAIVGGTLWLGLHGRRAGFDPKDIRHIVLISLDTCRADHLSCYGYPRKTTPNIDAIAGEGVLFKNVISPVPLTLPAHSSIVTGMVPPSHGVHDNFKSLAPSYVTLAELLKQQGFTTAACVGAFVLDSQFGMDQGFDTYKDDFPQKTGPIKPVFIPAERRGGDVSDFACQWLGQHKDENFFLFLHYYDPHDPYRPPEPFASQFARMLYAGEIAYTDHCVGRVLQQLKMLGLYDSTLIIITGDHGELLGEHGELTHGYFIYQNALSVPLIIKLPGSNLSRRIETPVSIIDVMPTVLNLLDITTPEQIQGQNLVPFFQGRPASSNQRIFYCESLTPREYNCNPLLGVVSYPWKYIHTTGDELYNLSVDPGESMNLAQKEISQARLLEKHLSSLLEQYQKPNHQQSNSTLDQSSINRLRSLGYVGEGVVENFEIDYDKPDPKDYLSLHQEKKELMNAIGRKEFGKAEQLYVGLLDQYPDQPWLYELAGRVSVAINRTDQAARYFQRSIQLNPENPRVRADLAAAFYKLAKYRQALPHFQAALPNHPNQYLIHRNLARTYNALGEMPQAVKHWTEAIGLNPGALGLCNRLAWVLATSKDKDLFNPEEALRLALHCCQLNGYQRAEYVDTLAAAYASNLQFVEAVKMAKKAVQLAQEQGLDELAGQIAGRLRRYEAGQRQ